MEEEDVQTIGKYKIIGTLGRGSMGVVYKAQDPEIGRVVAIKTLRKIAIAKFHNSDVALERFKIEARSAGNLRHPNIITVFDVNIEGDTPYIVMDFVEGESLDVKIARESKLKLPQVLHYLEQIAGGLDAAHKKGVIHRDIKPSNLIIDAQARIYLLDFGVAKMSESISESKENDKSEPVMGTPGYMSPEQILNEKLDARTDLFSLAIVAFESLSGKRPFPGDTFTELVSNILNSKPLALTAVAPEMPLALEVEFERALARKREDRFESANEMFQAFKKAAGVNSAAHPFAGDDYEGGRRRRRLSSEWKSIATKKIKGIRSSRASEAAAASKEVDAESDHDWSPVAVSDHDLDSFFAKGHSPEKESEGPGKMFATEETPFGSSLVMEPTSFSLMRVLIVVALLIGVVSIGAMLWSAFPNEFRAIVGLEPIKPPVDDNGSNVQIKPEPIEPLAVLDTSDYDPVPAGKAISELSDRELLGIFVEPGVSESTIIEALREGLARRISKFLEASITLLDHDSYIVRNETIKTLTKMRDKRVVPKLVTKLDDHDPLIRSQAAKALGILGSRKAISYLKSRYIKEELDDVRQMIKWAIEKINGYPMKG